MRDLPIACELTPEELATRRASLLAQLVRSAAEVAPTERGYRLVFSGERETVALVLAAIEAERACCRFLRFVVTFDQEMGPLTLEIDGPEGTRDFLATLLAPPEEAESR